MTYFKIRSLLLLHMHRVKKTLQSGLSLSLSKVTLLVSVQSTEAIVNLTLSPDVLLSQLSHLLVRSAPPSVHPSACYHDIPPVWSQLISHSFSVAVHRLPSPNSTARPPPRDPVNVTWVCQVACWNPGIQSLCHLFRANTEIRGVRYNSFLFNPCWSLQ